MLYCYIIPIVLYLNICTPNIWTKAFSYIIITMIAFIYLGANYVNLKALLKFVHTSQKV